MGREEQQEEREVLSAIFPDEITDTDEHAFHIAVTLDESIQDGDGPSPTLLLTISLPEAYPDMAPQLDILPGPNGTRHPHFDLSSDKPSLITPLESAAEDNLGMQMIFTLVSTLKETAESLITTRLEAGEREKEQEVMRKEEEENRKFQGEKVNRETFSAWREKFRKELEEKALRAKEKEEAEMKKGKAGVKAEDKLTGKQLWERGLVGKGDEDEEGLEEGVGALKVEG